MSECHCPTPEAALQCRRAGVTMRAALHTLCQASADHRALWDSLAKGEEPPPPPDGAHRLRTCVHRRRPFRASPDPAHARWIPDPAGQVVKRLVPFY